MKSEQVLLRDSVAHLGKVGDVVKVAAGYARNYLLPKGMAIQATPENVRLMARKRERLDIEEAARMAEYQVVVEKLGSVRVEVSGKADEGGSLYGSINAAAIAEQLSASGHDIDERRIRLEHPLKSTGEHPVKVHVHGELEAEITVVVTAEA